MGSNDTASIEKDPYLSTISDSKLLQNTLSIEQQYLQKLQDKYKEDEWFVRYQKNSTTGTYEPVFYSKSQIEDADYSEKPEHQFQVSDRMYMVKQPKQEKSKMQPLE